MKNMVYIQSGGPTSVINTSLYGAIKEAKKHPDLIGHIYGSQHGVEGLIDDPEENFQRIFTLLNTPLLLKTSKNTTLVMFSSMVVTTPWIPVTNLLN